MLLRSPPQKGCCPYIWELALAETYLTEGHAYPWVAQIQ